MAKLVSSLIAALVLSPSVSAAATLLSIDLSIANQITVVAEPGLANATVSGSDGVGIYLPNFFADGNTGFGINNTSGDFSSTNQTSDGSANLWSYSGDTGLNIWSFVNGGTVSFTDGTQAFTGSATWNLTPGLYAEFVNAPGAGSLFFPADSANDIVGQTAIGEFTTSNAVPAPVPVPASVLLLGSVLLGLGLFRPRRKQSDGMLLPA